MLSYLTVVIVAMTATGGSAFLNSKVCYGTLGCFSRDNGFDNALDELPESPNDVAVTLTLFTRKGGAKGQVLNYEDESTLANSHFDPQEETKVIVHGYLSAGNMPWVTNSTKYFLMMDNFNVIVVDWSKGAYKFYPTAVANTRLVGAIIATVLKQARDKMAAKMENVHLIGHSLGSHVSGYAGSRVEGLGRITGLDPAGPLFEGTRASVRLDPTDAIYVDNIHTDAQPLYDAGLGTMDAWGHIDFYPNGGSGQPGCPAPVKGGLLDIVKFKFTSAVDSVSCSHLRSHDLFVASLADTSCTFTSYPCSDYNTYKRGQCDSCGTGACPQMGYNSYKAHREGKFYLTTLGNYPFCRS